MKRLCNIVFCFNIIISALFSFSDKRAESDLLLYNNISRITVTGSASITILNNKDSNYGINAKDIITQEGGKINRVIREQNKILSKTNSVVTHEKLSELVGVDTIEQPTEFVIDNVYPNPFNPVITISYGLPKDSPVKIIIHDLQGRMIYSYAYIIQSAGWHEYIWNGTNSFGQSVGTGIYLITIHTGELVKKQKITLLK